MPAILQTKLPEGVPWRHAPAARLPGLSPLPMEKWLLRDDAFDAQMALRDQLVEERHDDVISIENHAIDAARECLEALVEALWLDSAYRIDKYQVYRPDGVSVPLDPGDPMRTIGRLVQSDLCLMQDGPDGYALSGAALCFPASWRLSEKIGKPLQAIHAPVPEYDANLGARVQRVFEALRPEVVLTRSNMLVYDKPDLFAPRSETDKRPYLGRNYLRTERQTLRRLPQTGVVVFGIHTTVMAMDDLPDEDRQAIRALTGV